MHLNNNYVKLDPFSTALSTQVTQVQPAVVMEHTE